jgi:acetolactate synthase-1/3 small subunit
MVIAMVADEPVRIKHFIDATKRYSPIEIVRGGVVAIER